MELKATLREEVWRKLDEHRVAKPRPCRGRVPLFAGAPTAALKVVKREFFAKARVVHSSVEPSLQPLREEVLRAGKTLVAIAPNFSNFVVVDGSSLPKHKLRWAASLRGLMTIGSRVKVLEGVRVDVVVLSSVAVDRRGGRLGVGDGRQDFEYATLRELGVVGNDTPVVTAVHHLQVVDSVPMELHDAPVDYVSTPTLFLRVEGGYRKPRGIIWDTISTSTLEKMPLLKLLAGLG